MVLKSVFDPGIGTVGVISGGTLASDLGGAKDGALGVKELNPIASPEPLEGAPKEMFGAGLLITPNGIVASLVVIDEIVDKEFALESDFS